MCSDFLETKRPSRGVEGGGHIEEEKAECSPKNQSRNTAFIYDDFDKSPVYINMTKNLILSQYVLICLLCAVQSHNITPICKTNVTVLGNKDPIQTYFKPQPNF